MLNAQLDRLPGIIEAMRAERNQVLAGTVHLAEWGLKPAPMRSADFDCATQLIYNLPTAQDAACFADLFPCVIAGKTGRHTYVEWDQILLHQGAAHPLMNPYKMPANEPCRRVCTKHACPGSLAILNRTVMIAMNPRHTQSEISDTIASIDTAARATFGQVERDHAKVAGAAPVDTRKFDITENEQVR